jgi:phage baseplate assembly protein W
MQDLYVATKCDHKVNGILYTLQQCPRCLGQSYTFELGTNDIILAPNKQFKILQGIQKMKQNVIKLLLTERGSHPDDPLYGTLLHSYIGMKMNSYVFAGVKREIVNGLTYYNQLNIDNPNPEELIDKLQDFKITRNETSPTAILVEFSIINQTGNEVDFYLKVGA